MSAEVETMVSAGGVVPWHKLGTVRFEELLTAAECIEYAGLDWEVELSRIYAPSVGPAYGSYVAVPEKYLGVQRQTDGKILGVVTKKYHPVQPRDAFSFMDNLTRSDDAKYETAGALFGGENIWLLAKISHEIEVAGLGDESINFYLLLSNSFNGKSSLSVSVTPVRVVCNNTLQMGLAAARRTWTARHREGILGKMKEAEKTLELTFKYANEFEAAANELVGQKFSELDMVKLLDNLVPLDIGADARDEGGRSFRNKEVARESIMALFKNADNLANVRGTAWAGYNAVAEYSDHGRISRSSKVHSAEENWFKKVWVDDASLKSKSLTVIRDMVGIS